MCAHISWGDAARQPPIAEQPDLLSGAGGMVHNMGGSMPYDNYMYAPPPVDEFSQIIAQLPPALRNIEPQLLQILVQDEGHIAFILNPVTGDVDPTKLDILRHQLLGSGSMNSQAYSSSASSSMGGMYQNHHRSSSSSNMYSNGGNGGGNGNMSMRGGQAQGQGLAPSDRYGGGPMGFDRGGRDHENSWEMGHSRDRERDRDRPDQRDNRGGDTSRGDNRLGDRERASEREREQREREQRERDREREREREREKDSRLAPGHGTKASTPCKFFNTRSGCRFGDLCPFGHFKGDDSGSSGGGGPSSYGPTSRGGPAVRGRGSGRR